MTPDQFNIDVQQINPLDFGEGTEELEARRAEAAAEEQMQAQQQAGTADQAQQKDEAFATGGRNNPQQCAVVYNRYVVAYNPILFDR